MVSQPAIVFMLITVLLSFVFPVGAVVYLYKKKRISLKAVGVGALTFLLFQFATRIPLLTLLSTEPWFQGLMGNLFFSAVLIGGVSAGLFEEVGRYLAFRFPLKRNLSWKNGLAYGLGHGGIEAIMLVGVTYIYYIGLSLMLNAGQFDSLIGTQFDAETAAMIRSQLVNTPPVYFLFGGLERFFTLFIHIGLSLMVLYGVITGKIRYLLYAILLHTLVNAPTVIMFEMGVNIWLVQGFILLLAVLALVWIVRSRSLLEPTGAGGEEDEGGVTESGQLP